MTHALPPIVKAAERLMLEIEQAVRRFPRYHKYTHGTRLREQAMAIARLAHRAWRDQQNRPLWTTKLVWAVDDLKLSLQLGKQIEAFVSFAQFDMLARLCADLGKQCGGWRRQQQRNSQNAGAGTPAPQRAEILSSRIAPGANP
jgi:hypothetical protein